MRKVLGYFEKIRRFIVSLGIINKSQKIANQNVTNRQRGIDTYSISSSMGDQLIFYECNPQDLVR